MTRAEIEHQMEDIRCSIYGCTHNYFMNFIEMFPNDRISAKYKELTKAYKSIGEKYERILHDMRMIIDRVNFHFIICFLHQHEHQIDGDIVTSVDIDYNESTATDQLILTTLWGSVNIDLDCVEIVLRYRENGEIKFTTIWNGIDN